MSKNEEKEQPVNEEADLSIDSSEVVDAEVLELEEVTKEEEEEEPEEEITEEPYLKITPTTVELKTPVIEVTAKLPVLTECPTCAKSHGLHVPLEDGKCKRCGFST